MSFYWQVKMPENGEDFTREQAWAALEQERQDIEAVARQSQVDGLFYNTKSPLSKEEFEELTAIRGRLRNLTSKLGLGTLEQLAEIADDPEGSDDLFPKYIARFLDGYHSDFSRFCRNHKRSDIMILGFAILQAGGFERERIAELLRFCERGQYRHYGTIWICPRCDGNGQFKTENRWQPETCKRCFGWGYVIQEKEPEADEYDRSDEGKRADNKGEPWTDEQEKYALRRQSGEDEEDEDA